MQLLSQYALIKGRSPVGAITSERGTAYVGTQKIDKGNGIVQTIPYERNQILKSSIPSIPLQLQFYANNAINSWNSYIKD